MAHGGYFGEKTESQIIDIELASATWLLRNGITVIVDDTNLNPMVVAMFGGLATKLGVPLIIRSYTHVPWEECVRRNNIRRAAHGQGIDEEVIIGMAEKYGLKEIESDVT